jgi:hypothetical protein
MRESARNLTSMTATIAATSRAYRKRDWEKREELDVNDTNHSGDFRTYRKRGEEKRDSEELGVDDFNYDFVKYRT